MQIRFLNLPMMLHLTLIWGGNFTPPPHPPPHPPTVGFPLITQKL